MKMLIVFLLMISCFFEIFAQQPDSTWQAKNLSINSDADDYLPFLLDTALMFTSTRKNSREDKLLEYSENVYYAFGQDTNFAKVKRFSYKANSGANTALVACSDSSFFFYRSYFPNNGELFTAPKKQEMKIKAPKKIPNILSEFDENSIAVYGNIIYFTSNRYGSYDIFWQKDSSKVEPLTILNSPFDETGIWISPSGKELYFSSNRESRFDIYKSTFDGQWQAPQKLLSPINTEFDEQDYRKYNDSTILFSSNRSGGKGGFDIYKLMKPKIIETPDTTQLVVEEPEDSIPEPITASITIPVSIELSLEDSLTVREQLYIELKELGLIPFRGEIQVGAYRKYLTSVELFKDWFKCIETENIRMDVFEDTTSLSLRKFVIDKLYTDLDEALNKQSEIIQRGCFPTTFEGTPFIALLRADQKRYAIFWQKEEYETKEVLWITLDGKEVWRSK